uniref:Transmembrane protein 144 n=1 Tax=Caenorhabditis japonica TaxID=281687 RepID=A0A8R1DQ15_CAEJA
MFVPIKSHDSRDGIFAQWMMSIAILLVGFIVYAFIGFPGFYPLAMLGGASWCLGNATAIPIISRLGLAVSILIWNTTNCLTGWAGGRFGLFGMKAQLPASPLLNYLGLICVVIGGSLFAQVRSEPSAPSKKRAADFDMEQLSSEEKKALKGDSSDEAVEVLKPEKDLNSGAQRLMAFGAALIAGVFYGMTFVPVIRMIDNPDLYPGYPTDGISYVFSHYFGIFLTSTILFVTYSIFRKNKPYAPPTLFLPGMAAGTLWAIAQTSFFVANQHLSQTVTFPIISQMPGCIAAAWSIFYYKEIRGRRNFLLLGAAMSITITGAILVGLSKAIEF